MMCLTSTEMTEAGDFNRGKKFLCALGNSDDPIGIGTFLARQAGHFPRIRMSRPGWKVTGAVLRNNRPLLHCFLTLPDLTWMAASVSCCTYVQYLLGTCTCTRRCGSPFRLTLRVIFASWGTYVRLHNSCPLEVLFHFFTFIMLYRLTTNKVL
jgi:hypothetical protein